MSLSSLQSLNSPLDLTVGTLKYKTAKSPYIQFMCKAGVPVNINGEEAMNWELVVLPLLDAITGEPQTFPNKCLGAIAISTSDCQIEYAYVESTTTSVSFTAYSAPNVDYSAPNFYDDTLYVFFIAYGY